MSVEEMAAELGKLMAAPRIIDRDKIKKLCRALEDCGALVEDDRRGNGWRVMDDVGMQKIPNSYKTFVWSEKAWAWAYWCGLGQPREHRFLCQSDPVEETKAIMGDTGPVDFNETELVFDENAKHLRVVK